MLLNLRCADTIRALCVRLAQLCWLLCRIPLTSDCPVMYHWWVLEETGGLCRASYRCVETQVGRAGRGTGSSIFFSSDRRKLIQEMSGCLAGSRLGIAICALQGPDKGEEA